MFLGFFFKKKATKNFCKILEELLSVIAHLLSHVALVMALRHWSLTEDTEVRLQKF